MSQLGIYNHIVLSLFSPSQIYNSFLLNNNEKKRIQI